MSNAPAATLPTLEAPAYPPLLQGLAVCTVVGLGLAGWWTLPALRAAQWTDTGLALWLLAALLMLWVGYWMVRSRTRLDGDVLHQTWLWDKQVKAQEVATFKLVHWPALAQVMAPRLLVRKRNGAVVWFHCADAGVLRAFAERVVRLSNQLH